MLVVVQSNGLAGNLFDLVGRRIVPHDETRNLRCGAVPGTVVIASSPSQVFESQPFFEIF